MEAPWELRPLRGRPGLRRGVLAHGDGSRGLGEGLVVSRGMAAWMRAWVDMVPSRQYTPPEAYAPEGHLPVAGRGEMVSIVAHMALGAR